MLLIISETTNAPGSAIISRASDNSTWSPSAKAFVIPPPADKLVPMARVSGVPTELYLIDPNVPPCPQGDSYFASVFNSVTGVAIEGPISPGEYGPSSTSLGGGIVFVIDWLKPVISVNVTVGLTPVGIDPPHP